MITLSNASNSNNKNLKGIYLMVLSSFSFSIMFLGVKLFGSAPTFTLIFYRSIVQAILSGSLLLFKNRRNKESTATAIDDENVESSSERIQMLLILRAAFGSIAVAAFFYAVQNLPLPDAITLQFTTPVFAALLAVPLLGECWKKSDKVGAVVCLTGVLMIARPSWLFSSTATTGTTTATTTTTAMFVGLLGAWFAGLAYVLVRKVGSRVDANLMVFYYAIFSTLTAPLGSKLIGGDEGTWNVMALPAVSKMKCQLLVFLGLGLFGFFGQLFTNRGLQNCESAAVATLVTNTQIVFAYLFEVTIIKESLSSWSLVGTALIVGYMASVGVCMMAKNKNIGLKEN
jgi:drug/metabolite transporter (DMT)-like permease